MPWSAPSRSRLEVALVAAALLGATLLAVTSPATASTAPFPVFTTGNVVNITLYGDALSGWGLTNGTITEPGPHLNVSYGDTVQLTLIANDGATHNWFVDYDNNSAPSGAEPSSPRFTSASSIVWSFTADRIGTFVYRCEIHPSSMMGLITIAAPTHYTLYGSALDGWGFTNTSITTPGPTLIVEEGVNVTLTLYANDTAAHTWFADYDNSSSVNGGETTSPKFGGTGNPASITYTFNANRAGTFAYRCGFHVTTMWGVLIVLGKPAPAQAGFPIGLIPGIMIAVIVGVLFLAVVYQVRATRAARMKK